MSKELALKPEPTIGMLLAGVIEQGITSDNVAALTALCGLKERMDAKEAEREFAQAMVELQGETIRVQATKAVDVKNGVPRYRFAPYEEIMAVVQPMLTRHGFSITFDTEIDESGARLFSICTLTHKSGFSRSNKFAVRFGKPPGSSEAQGDMSTKSYAKRGALCDALNITISHDDDARMVGGPISQEAANDLKRRVQAVGANEEAFLKFAGAAHYEAISEERLDSLDEMLTRKERGGKRNEKGEFEW